MRILVDHDRCTGLGMCEAPELFEVQDDGSLSVLDDNPPSARLIEAARAACEARPAEALSLVE
jgi:ferredoxin